jgi:hypothetical protein
LYSLKWIESLFKTIIVTLRSYLYIYIYIYRDIYKNKTVAYAAATTVVSLPLASDAPGGLPLKGNTGAA